MENKSLRRAWRDIYFPPYFSDLSSPQQSYYRKKIRLMAEIQDTEVPRCRHCGTVEDLEFERPEDSGEGNKGGWQMLTKIEEQVEQGKEVQVYCGEHSLSA